MGVHRAELRHFPQGERCSEAGKTLARGEGVLEGRVRCQGEDGLGHQSRGHCLGSPIVRTPPCQDPGDGSESEAISARERHLLATTSGVEGSSESLHPNRQRPSPAHAGSQASTATSARMAAETVLSKVRVQSLDSQLVEVGMREGNGGGDKEASVPERWAGQPGGMQVMWAPWGLLVRERSVLVGFQTWGHCMARDGAGSPGDTEQPLHGSA